MKTIRLLQTATLVLTSALSLQPSALVFAAPLGTAFTYHGWLNDTGHPAQGIYDLRFTIYDAPADGSVVAGPLTSLNVEAVGPPGTFRLYWLGFTPASTDSVGAGPEAVAAADVNGDGWMDLAIGTDTSSDGILLFSNEGQGQFALRQTLAQRGPSALLAVDLNGNKQPDLVCVETPADSLSILLGTAQLNYHGLGLGLGRFATANRLEVEGDASKTAAGSWLANSDRRIKREIATVTNALETLAKVWLVSFRYTDAYRAQHPTIADHRYLNVVAQEFAEVFPDAVKSSGENLAEGGDEILQVDTYPLTIYSAAAIQELQQALDNKNSEITELKTRLEKLERRLDDKSRGSN